MKAESSLSEADGRRLAVDMLVEMRRLGFDELAINGADECREGRPQNDVLVRYLRTVRSHPEVEAGFLAVLTDVIGDAAAAGGAIELYERESSIGR